MLSTLVLLFASVLAGRKFTREEILARLGTKEKVPNRLPVKSYPDHLKANLPASFDSRTNWPQCKPPVRDQAQCGSCWAHGAVESLSWRQCTNGIVSSAMELAPQWLVDCDRGNLGCNGGQLPAAWSFMSIFGVADENCRKYVAVNQECTDLCDNGSKPKLYYAAGATTFAADDLESAMYDIMTNGPLETAFSVYEDFEEYTGGIYQHTYGEYLGGHAVMVVGWGEENGVKYWIVQNSWGTGWGEDGYFRIIRGTNECGFEGQFTAGPAGKTAYEPPVPKISDNYYTVFALTELGMKQGTAVWVKDAGVYFREEAYTPGVKVIETGHSGANGHIAEMAKQGDMVQCICKDGLTAPMNILEVPEGLTYSGSYWSGNGQEKTIEEYILSDYTYKVGSIESITYTFAQAAIETVATPWYIKESVYGIDMDIEVVIYDSEADMSSSTMFADPCKCE